MCAGLRELLSDPSPLEEDEKKNKSNHDTSNPSNPSNPSPQQLLKREKKEKNGDNDNNNRTVSLKDSLVVTSFFDDHIPLVVTTFEITLIAL